MRSILLLQIILFVDGCNISKHEEQFSATFDESYLKYATVFAVSFHDGYKLVEIRQPYPGSTESIRYMLVEKGKPVPSHDPAIKIIRTPIESIVCTSTTHIPLLEYLETEKALTGFPSTNYISSESMRKRIDAGEVEELGVDKGMNLEKLAMLKPELVMAYSLTGDMGQFKKIESLGIPVVLNNEYLEKHPLGRAEWIKFMALFFNLENKADSVFTAIEKRYLQTQSLVLNELRQPTVMSGIVYGDTWFLPGGQNYAARLFHDAGYQYLWSDNDSNGFLELSFESVYAKAFDADFWIGVGSYATLKQIAEADNRYTKFKAYQTGNVFTYDARKGATGGSEFLELGYLRPDLILNDLVKIAYPELLPDHQLYFHKRLE